jgi:hypothetical protein
MSMYIQTTSFISAKSIVDAVETGDEDEAHEVFAGLLQKADELLEVRHLTNGSREEQATQFDDAATIVVNKMDGEEEREIALAFASALVRALQEYLA